MDKILGILIAAALIAGFLTIIAYWLNTGYYNYIFFGVFVYIILVYKEK